MSEKTGISWTDATFNPWWGCQKVSPACDHCYAERDAKRFAAGQVLWGVGAERRTFGEKHWAAPLNWAKTMPTKLGRRPRVFCASMGDWLDLDAPIGEFVRLLDLIRITPGLDWLLLSKRIGNWRKRLEAAAIATLGTNAALHAWLSEWLKGHPPLNVWVMATVVTQDEADRDITKLLAVPARVRGLSIEPMLGPITLPPMRCDRGSLPGPGGVGGVTCPDCDGRGCLRLHWVIAGGESGTMARPSHPDWYRALRDQCAAAGVPFHFKQWGEWKPLGQMPHSEKVATDNRHLRDDEYLRLDGTTHTTLKDDHEPFDASDILIRRVGKVAAGRQLDGVEHNGFPYA